MRKARVTIRRVRRKTDYDIGVTGARVGHVYFRYTDIHALRIRRGRFFGPKIAILSTEVIDYRIHADAQSVEEYLDALQSAWASYREGLWTTKSV